MISNFARLRQSPLHPLIKATIIRCSYLLFLIALVISQPQGVLGFWGFGVLVVVVV